MQGGFTRFVRRAVLAAARRTPVLRGLFFQINELRSQNADLRSQNAALDAERDRAVSLQLASDRQRDEAEKARWHAVSEREEAEKARWTAVAEREIAERARWAAVRQREHADAALRQALVGSQAPPKQQNRANGGSRHPPLERPSVTAAKLNGSQLEPGAKISIVLPNFNHGSLLKDNIDGVRAQTYANWELLIVDDGSTDNSRAVIEAAAARDQRILPIFLPHNRGAMFAAQTALAAASGGLLYGSAADDYIVNERFFESVVAMLGRHPEAAGVYGKAVVVDSASGRELWRMGSAPVKEFVPPESALESFLKGGIFVPGAAAIWKRALFDSLGGFDPELGPQTDFFINHALPIAGGAVFVDEVFAVVRAGAGNYHRAASDEDFFRRHAMVEIKLRALKLAQPIDPIWLRIWRDRLINSHLAVTRQQQIYASLRGTLTNIEAWEREGLPAGFEECSASVLAQVGAWQDDLDKRVSAAHDVFDALAGPLGLEMVKPARGPETAAAPEAAR